MNNHILQSRARRHVRAKKNGAENRKLEVNPFSCEAKGGFFGPSGMHWNYRITHKDHGVVALVYTGTGRVDVADGLPDYLSEVFLCPKAPSPMHRYSMSSYCQDLWDAVRKTKGGTKP